MKKHSCKHHRLLALGSLFAIATVGFAQSPYIVGKAAHYFQAGPGAPVLDAFRPYRFEVQANDLAPANVALTFPGGSSRPIGRLPGGDVGFSQNFFSKAALDAAFPAGNYAVTGTGLTGLSFNLTTEVYPTTVPQVTNTAWNSGGLLVVDPTQNFTVTFSTFSGYATATVGAFVGLDNEFAVGGLNFDGTYVGTPILGPVGVPTQTTPITSAVIPARTMTSGRVYSFTVEFGNAPTFATSTSAPAGALSAFSNVTTFWIAALTPGTAASPPPVIARAPTDVSTRLGANATFTQTLTFNGQTTVFPNGGAGLWYFNGFRIDQNSAKYTVNAIQLTVQNITADDVGDYYYHAITTGGMVTGGPYRLSLAAAPTIAAQPAGRTVVSGTTTVFSVEALGSPAPTYQWRKDTVAITGATSAMLVLPNAAAAQAGSYTCVVTNANGTVTSNPATLAISTSADFGRIVNLSILTGLATGEGNFTVGTVIGGAGTTGTKPLLVRAAGPTLGAAPFNIGGVLPDPKLDLYSGSTVIASNDNWAGAAALSNAFTAVGAFPYVSATAKDAALFNPTLAAGGYTIQVSDAAGGTGTVIAELYDSTPAANFTPTTLRLVNVSVLKQIPTGEILTAGFVIGGSTAKTVLIRVVGPTLGGAPFNISGVMADPKLDLYSGSNVIASNDNWGGDAQLTTVSNSVGAFALSSAASKDAVLLVTLPPGAYTAQASSVSTGGLAIIEVYEVP